MFGGGGGGGSSESDTIFSETSSGPGHCSDQGLKMNTTHCEGTLQSNKLTIANNTPHKLQQEALCACDVCLNKEDGAHLNIEKKMIVKRYSLRKCKEISQIITKGCQVTLGLNMNFRSRKTEIVFYFKPYSQLFCLIYNCSEVKSFFIVESLWRYNTEWYIYVL